MCGAQAKEELGACCLYSIIEWAREQLPVWLSQAKAVTAIAESQHAEPEKDVDYSLQTGQDTDDEVTAPS